MLGRGAAFPADHGRGARAAAGWPTMPEVGIPAALAATHDLLPVHPVTARDRLALALAEAGLSWPAAGRSGPWSPPAQDCS